MSRVFLTLILLTIALVQSYAADTPTAAGATNMRFEQRQAVAPWTKQPFNFKGNEYPNYVLGFNSNGIFTPLNPLLQSEWDTEKAALLTTINLKAPLTHTHLASDISNSTTIGRQLLTAVDQADVQSIVGITGGGGGGGNLTSTTPVTADHIVVYNGTTGTLVTGGGYTVTALRDRANHSGTQALNTIAGIGALAGLSEVGSAEITNGSIVNADINANAAIALSKLATDPLNRANHSGTQLLNTISNAGALAGLSEVGSDQITNGSIVNADISASAAIAASKVADVGITKSGTQVAPTTTSPLNPTWTTQDYTVYYGATGTINLPAVAAYANKAIFIYITGNFTVTIDPNGLEVIVVNGSPLSAGTADVVAGVAGSFFGYVCDGARWVKIQGGSGVGDAVLVGGNNFSGNQNVAGNVTATSFIGSATGLTFIPASELTGNVPALTYATITTPDAVVYTPTAGVSNTIDTGKALTTITLDAVTETLTYNTTPATGTIFHYLLSAHTSDCTVTIPSTYSFSTGSNRTTYVVRANKNAYISVFRSATAYYMWGDPVEIGTLPEDTTPATTAKIEIDQGTGNEYTTIANILNGAAVGAGTATTPSAGDNDTSIATTAFVQTEVDGTSTGSWASPYTTASALSPTWSGPVQAVYMGVAQTVQLPDAAAYANRGIVVYSTGAFTITIDPDADDFIVRDGNQQNDGVTITLSSGAGNYVCLISDGTNWVTLGYKGTIAQGS